MKERKGLHPAIAFTLMLLMLCGALLNGAHQHWRGEWATIEVEAWSLQEAMDVRVETAHNLLTVAQRHLPKDDALCASVISDRDAMQNTSLPLAERIAAAYRFTDDAKALLTALSQNASVIADDRDHMYATLVLPQAVEKLEETSAFTTYDYYAEEYNKGLGSTVSGVLAQLIGYQKAPRLDSLQPAIAADMQSIAYPTQRGYVNDDAAVFSAQTTDDINELNDRMDAAEFVVVTRHFLGGYDAQEYCKGLFDYWWLDDDDVLLLLVIGEDRYAVMMGGDVEAYISDEQLSSLLSAHLRAPFITERDYDSAAGNFLLALGQHISRASGEGADLGGLFGTEATAPNKIFDSWSGNWWEGFFAENDYEDGEEESYLPAGDYVTYEAYDMDYSSLLVLAVILFAVIRSRRKKHKGGLGWFGWLILISIISQVGEWLGFLL